jgi:hypothetical protein
MRSSTIRVLALALLLGISAVAVYSGNSVNGESGTVGGAVGLAPTPTVTGSLSR